jgi:branched-chain amino acid transport system ATP-binding protein
VKLFQQVSSDSVAAGGASSDGSAVLRVEGLSAGYGKHQVLDGVSLEVARGDFIALLGHNGAGKTTALRSIIGQVKPTAGTVSFDGEVLTGRPVHVTAAAGIGLVPQGQGVFPSLTIDENLALAASLRTAADTSAAETREFVYELFGMLKERPRERAGSLSGGQRQPEAAGAEDRRVEHRRPAGGELVGRADGDVGEGWLRHAGHRGR